MTATRFRRISSGKPAGARPRPTNRSALDPVAAAKLARLRYVNDDMPGIDADLRRGGLSRERVLAAVVKLMEQP